MGHEEGGEPQRALLDLADLLAQAAANAGIQRRERLVQQQDPRPHHQRPGQRHPLALAAGELGRIAALSKPVSSTSASASCTLAASSRPAGVSF